MQSEVPEKILEFRFRGSGGEYFKIWIVNVLLTIMTLGVYSAWAKVRRERYFYSNTWLDDHAFEYLADPLEILKGRAVVFAVISLSVLLIRYHPWLEPGLWVCFIVLTPWIIVKSMRFRLSRTAYRNIRFAFNGTVGETAKAFLLWPGLVPLSLGLLLPYAMYRQKRLLVECSSYGLTPFYFHARPGEFYRVIGLAALIGVFGGAVAVGASMLIPGTGLFLVAVPLIMFLFAFVQAHLQNLVYNNVQLDQYGLQSNFEVRKLLWIVLTNVLGTALTMGLFTPWAKVRLARYRAECMKIQGDGELEHFLADQSRKVDSLGEEFGDAFDLDLAL